MRAMPRCGQIREVRRGGGTVVTRVRAARARGGAAPGSDPNAGRDNGDAAGRVRTRRPTLAARLPTGAR